MTYAPNHFAPGMRIELRDAEWRIKQVDHSTDGGYLLSCEGLSELVRGREGLFLTELERQHENKLRILDPAETDLVDDLSSGYRASLLYIDTLIRQGAPTDERIHLGYRAAIDQIPYQLDPARQALKQPRQRILIADSVGLGKTLEAGILVSELIARGRGRRILVLAVKSMLSQFQQEFWNRFTIPLVRLDSAGLQRVRNRIPANHNPFHYFDRSIISIDTLKQDIEYRHYLEQAYWDIIIIDEAHNVAERGSHSQRARLARLLANRSDTLIMLSATPHDGKAESFASLMNMLDPTAIANPSDYQHEDFRDKGLVIRRFKKDVRSQLGGNFPEREIAVCRVPATHEEEAVFDRLMEIRFHTLDGRTNSAGQLFRTTLEKALFSSPTACLSTIDNRIKRLESRELTPEVTEDIDSLQGLRLALEAVTPDRFSKYQQLLDLLQGGDGLGWHPQDPEDRLVLFTESIATLEFLEAHLPKALGLKQKQLAVLRGDMRDRELMGVVEAFGQKESPIRLLLCSDVASEGINLHHMSHRLIHFDIPWSLMVFQQRNGRIDRYGQRREPQIRYLLTESSNPKVQGDQRILEILIEKDEQACKNIGDPSEFMGQAGTREEQEEAVASFIEKDDDDISHIFADFLDENAESSESPLDNFIPHSQTTGREELSDVIANPISLYPGDYEYAKAAVSWLSENDPSIQVEVDDIRQRLMLTAPMDLVQRLRYLPREIRPEHDRFILSPEVEVIQQELNRCRQEDDPWPNIHYLWPLHPVVEWLADRALNAFGRHTAPVLRLPDRLDPEQHIILLHGGFPNRKSHPVLQAWLAAEFRGGQRIGSLEMSELIDRLNLHPGRVPNRAEPGDTQFLKELLPQAVAWAQERLRELRKPHETAMDKKLNAQMAAMDALKARHLQQLELQLESSSQIETLKQRRREEQQFHIARVFDSYIRWLEQTHITEETPFIQVVAIFTGART